MHRIAALGAGATIESRARVAEPPREFDTRAEPFAAHPLGR